MLVFARVSIERGLGQDKCFHRWCIYDWFITSYTHKVSNLSKTSLYINWAENHIETGHFQHNPENRTKWPTL